jgi:hypothetical protein
MLLRCALDYLFLLDSTRITRGCVIKSVSLMCSDKGTHAPRMEQENTCVLELLQLSASGFSSFYRFFSHGLGTEVARPE